MLNSEMARHFQASMGSSLDAIGNHKTFCFLNAECCICKNVQEQQEEIRENKEIQSIDRKCSESLLKHHKGFYNLLEHNDRCVNVKFEKLQGANCTKYENLDELNREIANSSVSLRTNVPIFMAMSTCHSNLSVYNFHQKLKLCHESKNILAMKCARNCVPVRKLQSKLEISANFRFLDYSRSVDQIIQYKKQRAQVPKMLYSNSDQLMNLLKGENLRHKIRYLSSENNSFGLFGHWIYSSNLQNNFFVDNYLTNNVQTKLIASNQLQVSVSSFSELITNSKDHNQAHDYSLKSDTQQIFGECTNLSLSKNDFMSNASETRFETEIVRCFKPQTIFRTNKDVGGLNKMCCDVFLRKRMALDSSHDNDMPLSQNLQKDEIKSQTKGDSELLVSQFQQSRYIRNYSYQKSHEYMQIDEDRTTKCAPSSFHDIPACEFLKDINKVNCLRASVQEDIIIRSKSLNNTTEVNSDAKTHIRDSRSVSNILLESQRTEFKFQQNHLESMLIHKNLQNPVKNSKESVQTEYKILEQANILNSERNSDNIMCKNSKSPENIVMLTKTITENSHDLIVNTAECDNQYERTFKQKHESSTQNSSVRSCIPNLPSDPSLSDIQSLDAFFKTLNARSAGTTCASEFLRVQNGPTYSPQYSNNSILCELSTYNDSVGPLSLDFPTFVHLDRVQIRDGLSLEFGASLDEVFNASYQRRAFRADTDHFKKSTAEVGLMNTDPRIPSLLSTNRYMSLKSSIQNDILNIRCDPREASVDFSPRNSFLIKKSNKIATTLLQQHIYPKTSLISRFVQNHEPQDMLLRHAMIPKISGSQSKSNQCLTSEFKPQSDAISPECSNNMSFLINDHNQNTEIGSLDNQNAYYSVYFRKNKSIDLCKYNQTHNKLQNLDTIKQARPYINNKAQMYMRTEKPAEVVARQIIGPDISNKHASTLNKDACGVSESSYQHNTKNTFIPKKSEPHVMKTGNCSKMSRNRGLYTCDANSRVSMCRTLSLRHENHTNEKSRNFGQVLAAPNKHTAAHIQYNLDGFIGCLEQKNADSIISPHIPFLQTKQVESNSRAAKYQYGGCEFSGLTKQNMAIHTQLRQSRSAEYHNRKSRRVNENFHAREHPKNINTKNTNDKNALDLSNACNTQFLRKENTLNEQFSDKKSNFNGNPPDSEYRNEFSDKKTDDHEKSDDKYLPAVGQIIFERFKIVKRLGEGSFGKVLLAYDILQHATVALKFINKKALKNAAQLERSRFEARLMSILSHPNICRLFDSIETDIFMILIMEHIEGEELFEYIVRQRKLNDSEARTIFQRILSGIAYLHCNNIVHRDMKPENIMISPEGVIKILDFGFASFFSFESKLTTYCGSPFYASPEMIQAVPYVGPETDIWSLGCILYVMTHGHFPFRASSVSKLYPLVLRGEFDIKCDDPALAHLLSRMICLDPALRITTQEVINHPWITGRPSNINFNVPVELHQNIKRSAHFEAAKRSCMQNSRSTGSYPYNYHQTRYDQYLSPFNKKNSSPRNQYCSPPQRMQNYEEEQVYQDSGNIHDDLAHARKYHRQPQNFFFQHGNPSEIEEFNESRFFAHHNPHLNPNNHQRTFRNDLNTNFRQNNSRSYLINRNSDRFQRFDVQNQQYHPSYLEYSPTRRKIDPNEVSSPYRFAQNYAYHEKNVDDPRTNLYFRNNVSLASHLEEKQYVHPQINTQNAIRNPAYSVNPPQNAFKQHIHTPRPILSHHDPENLHSPLADPRQVHIKDHQNYHVCDNDCYHSINAGFSQSPPHRIHPEIDYSVVQDSQNQNATHSRGVHRNYVNQNVIGSNNYNHHINRTTFFTPSFVNNRNINGRKDIQIPCEESLKNIPALDPTFHSDRFPLHNHNYNHLNTMSYRQANHHSSFHNNAQAQKYCDSYISSSSSEYYQNPHPICNNQQISYESLIRNPQNDSKDSTNDYNTFSPYLKKAPKDLYIGRYRDAHTAGLYHNDSEKMTVKMGGRDSMTCRLDYQQDKLESYNIQSIPVPAENHIIQESSRSNHYNPIHNNNFYNEDIYRHQERTAVHHDRSQYDYVLDEAFCHDSDSACSDFAESFRDYCPNSEFSHYHPDSTIRQRVQNSFENEEAIGCNRYQNTNIYTRNHGIQSSYAHSNPNPRDFGQIPRKHPYAGLDRIVLDQNTHLNTELLRQKASLIHNNKVPRDSILKNGNGPPGNHLAALKGGHIQIKTSSVSRQSFTTTTTYNRNPYNRDTSKSIHKREDNLKSNRQYHSNNEQSCTRITQTNSNLVAKESLDNRSADSRKYNDGKYSSRK